MEYSKFFVNLGDYQSCVHRFGGNASAPSVVLVHGSIENARIFFSKSGKGFAPWLAGQGFDVYVIDLPGKGESTPSVSRHFEHSQSRFVKYDLPELLAAIRAKNTSGILHLGAHSWGGVLLAAMLARLEVPVQSMVFFGSKRRLAALSLKRILMVDFLWSLVGTISTIINGYLPARALKIGSENEPRAFYFQTNKWVYSKKWIDPEDGFNYQVALERKLLPPTLFITGSIDDVLGHPKDVERFMHECKFMDHQFKILGKRHGNTRNYGHIDILTHPDAATDHFPLVLNWFLENGGIS